MAIPARDRLDLMEPGLEKNLPLQGIAVLIIMSLRWSAMGTWWGSKSANRYPILTDDADETDEFPIINFIFFTIFYMRIYVFRLLVCIRNIEVCKIITHKKICQLRSAAMDYLPHGDPGDSRAVRRHVRNNRNTRCGHDPCRPHRGCRARILILDALASPGHLCVPFLDREAKAALQGGCRLSCLGARTFRNHKTANMEGMMKAEIEKLFSEMVAKFHALVRANHAVAKQEVVTRAAVEMLVAAAEDRVSVSSSGSGSQNVRPKTAMSDCFFAKVSAAASLCSTHFSLGGICGLAY